MIGGSRVSRCRGAEVSQILPTILKSNGIQKAAAERICCNFSGMSEDVAELCRSTKPKGSI